MSVAVSSKMKTALRLWLGLTGSNESSKSTIVGCSAICQSHDFFVTLSRLAGWEWENPVWRHLWAQWLPAPSRYEVGKYQSVHSTHSHQSVFFKQVESNCWLPAVEVLNHTNNVKLKTIVCAGSESARKLVSPGYNSQVQCLCSRSQSAEESALIYQSARDDHSSFTSHHGVDQQALGATICTYIAQWSTSLLPWSHVTKHTVVWNCSQTCRKDIQSVRDLREDHLPLLENIRTSCKQVFLSNQTQLKCTRSARTTSKNGADMSIELLLALLASSSMVASSICLQVLW